MEDNAKLSKNLIKNDWADHPGATHTGGYKTRTSRLPRACAKTARRSKVGAKYKGSDARCKGGGTP